MSNVSLFGDDTFGSGQMGNTEVTVQEWRVQPGQVLRYYGGSGKPQHARVNAVASVTVVDLQVGTGATKATHAAVARRTTRAGTGWYRHASELT